MAHIRSQIRAAFAGLFAGDVPGVFSAVEMARAHRVDDEALPVLAIVFDQEQAQHGLGGPDARVTRRAEWLFSIACAGGDTIADDADALALIVESRIGADPELGGVVRHARVIATRLSLSGESRQRSAVLTLTVETLTDTPASDPETLA